MAKFKELNMKAAQKSIQKGLQKEWGHISFSYSIEENGTIVKATADISVNDLADNISIIFTANSGRGFTGRAVFDKLPITPEYLEMVNAFNAQDAFFKAFIRDDNYLELSNFIIVYDEGMLSQYVDEFLCRVVDLPENEIMKELASLTQPELE